MLGHARNPARHRRPNASPVSEALPDQSLHTDSTPRVATLNTNQVARIATLIGEPARTAMLIELMGGRALTASELARAAGVGASSASAHLTQLLDAQLLRVTASGRHRYYCLASVETARLIETLMQLAARTSTTPSPRLLVGPKDAALRAARSTALGW